MLARIFLSHLHYNCFTENGSSELQLDMLQEENDSLVEKVNLAS